MQISSGVFLCVIQSLTAIVSVAYTELPAFVNPIFLPSYNICRPL